jgi:hypothetical protein
MLKKMVVKLFVVALALTIGSASAQAFTMIEYSLVASNIVFYLQRVPDISNPSNVRVDPSLADFFAKVEEQLANVTTVDESDSSTFPDGASITFDSGISELESSIANNLSSITLSNNTIPTDPTKTVETTTEAQVNNLTFDVTEAGAYRLIIQGVVNVVQRMQDNPGLTSFQHYLGVNLNDLPLDDIDLVNLSISDLLGDFDDPSQITFDEDILIPFLPAAVYEVNLLARSGASTQAVPIPGAVWLLGTGLAGLGLLGKRRKRG